MNVFEGKTVLLGITGGIAAYKSAELTRELVKRGADVVVVMTDHATRFITPLTMQTLSGNPVYSETFALTDDWKIGHVSLAERADIIVVAPATANSIGKIASGIADDLFSTTIMAAKAPVLICPAMNTNMYLNETVKENIRRLASKGYSIMEAEQGELACRVEGPGRLPQVADIVEKMESLLARQDLSGIKILITAGPTREPLDPVRFISNYSSGKMGYALARASSLRGGNVLLVSGPTSLKVPSGVRFVSVKTAVEMRDCVMVNLNDVDVVIKAAAVADYRPATEESGKIKKSNSVMDLRLQRNPDIIAEIGKDKKHTIIVGFAMETDNLISNARDKMMSKNMDLVVANDLTGEGAGFQHDTNLVTLLDREGTVEALPLMDKIDVAHAILDRVRTIYDRRRSK